MYNLITPQDISSLARQIYIDDEKAMVYIQEAEDIDVRQWLGDALMLLCYNERPSDLLNGTEYTVCNGDVRYFAGLKKAIAYYAYSRLVLSGDIEVTRAGTRSRDSEYSHQAPLEERQAMSREATAIADYHLNGVIDYINHSTTYAAYACKRKADNERMTCKTIGD